MVDRANDNLWATASADARTKLKPIAAQGPTLNKCGKCRWQGHSLGRRNGECPILGPKGKPWGGHHQQMYKEGDSLCDRVV